MMRLSALFLLLSLSYSYGQNSDNQTREHAILNDVIKAGTIKSGPILVVSKIDSVNVEHLLKPLLEKPSIKAMTPDKAIVTLTKSDLEYFVKSIRAQYAMEWDADYFKPYRMIKPIEAMIYLEQDRTNQVVLVSKPIFLKDSELALVYFTDLSSGDVVGSTSLSLYKNVNGSWKTWIHLSGADF